MLSHLDLLEHGREAVFLEDRLGAAYGNSEVRKCKTGFPSGNR